MPLAAQSRDEPEPYSLPREDHERRVVLGVLHRRVVDRHLLAVRLELRDAALGPRRELVAQADVRERAAHHHLVVAAARAVGVEVLALDAVLLEVLAGRRGLLDRAGGRDVVGGHRVAEHREHARALDVGELGRLGREVLEVRRQAHVGRVVVPLEAVALRHLERVPALVAVVDLAVGLAEHVRLHGRLDGLGDLLLVRPDVLEEDVVAVLVLAERLVEQVDVHRPGDRVGDAQRRRGEVVHLHVGVDAALEVAVAREHGDDREVLGLDDVGDLLRQRTGVPDAGRAAVADEVEAERLEALGQLRALEVLGDDLRARARARSSPTAWTSGPWPRRCAPACRRRA